MRLFLSALCLALAIEGLLFALFPEHMRRSMLEISAKPAAELRALGATALVFAAILAFLTRMFIAV